MYENLSEFRIVPIIYDYDCLRKQFCAILEIQGVSTKILISLFFAFSVLSTVRLAEIAVLSKILRKNLFLKFQKNDVYKK